MPLVKESIVKRLMIQPFRSLTLTFFAAFLFSACGGPAPLPDNTDTTKQNDLASPCSAGATGSDCDSDGLTDQCEELIGTNKCDADSDDDGILDPDDADSIRNADPNEQGAFQDNLAYELERDLAMASSALSSSAPSGRTVVADKQQLAFGNIIKITAPQFLGKDLKEQPSCQTDKTIFIYVEGKVDGNPAHLELCGELNAPFDNVATDASKTDITHTLQKWTIGYAKYRKKKFDPQIFTAKSEGQIFQRFNKITIDQAERPCLRFQAAEECKNTTTRDAYLFKTLYFELESTYKFEFTATVNGKEVPVKTTDKIQKYWQRTYLSPDSLAYSNGFYGFWENSAPF